MNNNDKHAASYVLEPLRVDNSDAIQWQESTDVLVVGYGGAGVCAALEARAQGADVLALDRFEGGGATTLSGGIYYGGGTPYQHEAGYNDTPEEMYNYLKQEIGDAVRDETLRRFCNQSSTNMDWLCSHGIGFGSKVYEGKRSFPPKGYDIYYSGNELSPEFEKIARPAPRGHKVAGPGYTGSTLFNTLRDSAHGKGVRFQGHTVVTRLILDSSNQVVGVEALRIEPGSEGWKKHLKIIRKVNAYQRFIEKAALDAAEKVRAVEQQYGVPIRIRARQAVVLTTGSFAFNREMISHYAPKFSKAMALGTISCDGSGVVMGQGIGAALGHMDSVTAWRTISPPVQFVQGIVVNREGCRFVAEDVYLGRLGHEMAQQTEERAWVIIDSHAYWTSYKDTIPRPGEEGYLEFKGPLLINLVSNSTKGKTLADLAAKIGVDAQGLEAEVARYNAGIAAGKDPLGKKKSNCREIGKGPYYGIDISVGSQKFRCPTIPMGGLVVDEDSGQVLREDGSAIAGLYAAGRAAVGIPSGFYVSGSSIADCVFSGRRAGHSAAQLATDKAERQASMAAGA
ncbi:MAG: hypothetical protein VR73_01685 [Gammaproteobacteria bacterium BRH_c0]|nr:MAG: hypothetical protein VR73_01685 [Gammaproteobacteria bacterium BRH_c0]